MRKMFRMKYESCTGQCYAPSDVIRIHTLGLESSTAVEFLHRLLEIHQESCGNAQLSYALDVDEDLGVFVASFQRYGALDLFCGKTPLEALNKLIDAALRYYASEEYAKEVVRSPGRGKTVCEHGEDKKLISFAITFSGLPDVEQENLRQLMGVA